ncbi:3-hydroxyacyl-CoA dehydrogenase [Desulfopila aestuarii]|uniref:3-hydroxyacyl-CoA dehydrogenase n=1 Tax=Desulfopila aestuarii DSM 18488 TaxID=1121416 RepID=A0A1M7Y6K6_9BACT|nr:3-hydroxyacyl-CoA dehydrogenase [Desulfopila aestuarii]SHO48146.1 3-hydroxyacyl-CoA dehydrogenase [Desulfopila aestuarii DSM 18488]
MESCEMKKVLILGAGTMGLQIGVLCGASGFEVTIFDAFPEALNRAEARVGKLAHRLADHNRFAREKVAGALQRIRFSSDPEDAGKDADFINESVPEDPRIKAEVFARFHKICPEHTIFTTNTSTLIPSMIAEATGRPDRFLALHFHDCETTNVVDIMPHPGTSEAALEAVRGFCTAINHFPIELKKEQPGYVFNTMLSEWMGAALSLASKGVASVEDIDRAWMGIFRSRFGPFGIMDSIGLETVYKVTAYWAGRKNDPRGQKNAAFLKEYVDRGDLGKKTGKGFYSYPEPEYLSKEFLKGIY